MPQLSPTSGFSIFFNLVIICCIIYVTFSMMENKPLFFCGSFNAKILSVFYELYSIPFSVWHKKIWVS
uniref:ATP synthase F0 subunit 8 n=1 Tax=Biomphalaria glabrata TaxID=6526 RepID=A0A2U8J9L0_BIOGL|nr:ATP synthase F0 subunit 8 [Biomphalaria glabrata]